MNRKENLEKLVIRELPRIKGDSYGFRMAGLPPTHCFICGLIEVTPDVTRLDGVYPLNLIIDGLKTPEAASCQDGNFLVTGDRSWFICHKQDAEVL
jgi:hypothetical protein